MNVQLRVCAIYMPIATIILVNLCVYATRALLEMVSPVQTWMNVSFQTILAQTSLYVSIPLEHMYVLV